MKSYKWCWPEGFQFSYSETEWKRERKRGKDIKTTCSGNFLGSMERDVWLQSKRGIKWVEADGRQRDFLLMDEIRSHLYGFKDILCRSKALKKKNKIIIWNTFLTLQNIIHPWAYQVGFHSLAYCNWKSSRYRWECITRPAAQQKWRSHYREQLYSICYTVW